MRLALLRYLTTLLLGCLSLPLLAAPASQIKASYDVLGFGMVLAKITETYTRADDNYQIESVTKAVGLLARLKPETVRITSQGKITPQGLKPLNFSLTREMDTNKNASAVFNWDKATLTHHDYKGINDLALLPGTQDRLSVLYHLPLLAQTVKKEIELNITDGNNLEQYRFTLSPEVQTIRVPMGEFVTRYFSSLPVAGQITYEIWMVSERDNFPFKVIVTDSNGGKLTQVLTDLSVTP
jgi:hypothetical protein